MRCARMGVGRRGGHVREGVGWVGGWVGCVGRGKGEEAMGLGGWVGWRGGEGVVLVGVRGQRSRCGGDVGALLRVALFSFGRSFPPRAASSSFPWLLAAGPPNHPPSGSTPTHLVRTDRAVFLGVGQVGGVDGWVGMDWWEGQAKASPRP